MDSQEDTKPKIEHEGSPRPDDERSQACSGHTGSLLEKQAKAEAMKVRLRFAEKEMRMKKEKAMLELDLEFLQKQKAAAEIEAEVEVLGSMADSVKDLDLPVESRVHRTAEYVTRTELLNAEAPEFRPSEKSEVKQFSDFLLKKELLLSRFTRFNDKAETFQIWKETFKSIVSELEVNPFEEMDLLIKWLGPISSHQALTIRMANPRDANKGLSRIWERLEERFGCPEMVEQNIRRKLTSIPKLTAKDNKQFYELADICSEIESLKENQSYSTMFAHYDSPIGVTPIVSKLPTYMQERWTVKASNYKTLHSMSYPPFTFFVEFLHTQCKMKNDPSFVYETHTGTSVSTPRATVRTNKTSITSNDSETRCPIHKTLHNLNSCRAFQSKTNDEKRKMLQDLKLCFRCLVSTNHQSKNCPVKVSCSKCGRRHATVMHLDTPHGGEQNTETVTSSCTEICGENFRGKSCAKLIKVKVWRDNQCVLAYALLDEQSNRTLAKPALLDMLRVSDRESFEYVLNSCSGTSVKKGRRVSGLKVQSMDGEVEYNLTTVIECQDIPDNREEIPSHDVLKYHPHLKQLVDEMPEVDGSVDILLLIGRDVAEVHHVSSQITGPAGSPYAQRVGLGWVVVGEACLGRVHEPQIINVNKTFIIEKHRQSLAEPCLNRIQVKDNVCESIDNVFARYDDDDKVSPSIEDKLFVRLMEDKMYRTESGNWIAPLPFKTPRQRLPNNRSQAKRRAELLDSNLKQNPTKLDHFVTFMKSVIDCGHAELAPPIESTEEVWYLPIFGVYHPKKPDQIRGVFDASAKYQGVSLNDVLMTGPDFTNNLLGVLIRFRREPVAVTTDIQKMFYCFLVEPRHRNYLRFFWYKDNKPSNELVEYRMCAHVFGNRPSPAVANYGLRKVAEVSSEEYGQDVTEFIRNGFYVDDGLISTAEPTEPVDLIKRTQQALSSNGNIRLHKIASNDVQVLNAFPPEDLAKDLVHLD